MRSLPLAVLLCATLCLLSTSCTRSKTITADDLRSDLTSASSLASETETLLEFVQQRRATRFFAQGHIGYIEDEVNRSLKEFGEASPEAAIQDKFHASQALLAALAQQLTSISFEMDNVDALAAEQQRIEKIRVALEQTKSSL